ncbi:MAG TPA: peptide chain release factor H [Pseudosphingobacterium sp.]|nr:peptide chain release factor H [Pseudosphingobacterium sp.]
MEKKWIQITSGRGPAECQLLVAACYRDLLYRAEVAGLGLLLIHQDYDEKGKYLRSIVLRIEGQALSNWLKPWLGSIQWICRSPLRPFHKRKNWFVGCFELEQQVLLTFDEHEVFFQTMRSSGTGGQHVNKVSSAVRATHRPTGFVVQVMDTRSQWQNKQIAIDRLKWLVYQANLSVDAGNKQAEWLNQLQIGRGNPIRVYAGDKFSLRE